MFGNKIAIETLIRSDAKATDDEKSAVLAALRKGPSEPKQSDAPSLVCSIDEAARVLGKSRKAVYHLLHIGTLKGFYSGKTHTRATGVTRESLDCAVAVCKGGRR